MKHNTFSIYDVAQSLMNDIISSIKLNWKLGPFYLPYMLINGKLFKDF